MSLSHQNLDIFCIILRKLRREIRENVVECFFVFFSFSKHAKIISYCLK